jgi:AbiV family abortive infection protein
MSKSTIEAQAIREKCLANAESLVSVAERELDKNVDHVCFHLALLGLEEIGKAIMVSASFTVSLGDKERGDLGEEFDEHEKKIFWALWGGSMKQGAITKESIEQAQHLSKTLHARRLLYLYVDPSGTTDGQAEIKDGEAKNLTELVRARLEIEKLNKMVDEFDDEDVKVLTWFFHAIRDEEQAKLIFNMASLKKFEELGNGKDWMKWLKETFDKEETRMRELAQKEISRPRPEGEEAWIPKYKMTVRIQSQSHSIRNDKPFTKWNEGMKDIKLRKSDRKEAKHHAKAEMIMELTIPKGVHLTQVWNYGLFMAKTFISALNVATCGLFWWYISKDIEKYYDEITDLEVDRTGNTKLRITPEKPLAIGWDEARMVLDENTMIRVSMAYALFMREPKKLKEFLETYAFALTIFSKIDIHLRLETNAFHEFFKALKAAFLAFNDWDGKTDMKEAMLKKFKEIGDFKELGDLIQMGIDLEPPPGKPQNITLTEIAAIKMYCDFYIQFQAKQYLEQLASQNPKQ